jgi:hypothetical protein
MDANSITILPGGIQRMAGHPQSPLDPFWLLLEKKGVYPRPFVMGSSSPSPHWTRLLKWQRVICRRMNSECRDQRKWSRVEG